MSVFNPNPAFFPARTVEETSPLGGVLSDAIAKRLAMAKAETAENEAPYAGISKLAEASSRSAYAGAVVPQFQAKLMEHPELLASIPDPKDRLKLLLAYSDRNNTTSSLNKFINDKLLQISTNQNSRNNFNLGSLGNLIKNIFTGNQNQSQYQPDQVNQDNNQSILSQTQQSNPIGYKTSTPQQTQDEGIQTVTPNAQSDSTQNGRTPQNIQFGENAASLHKQIEKGKETGKEEGKQQASYGPTAQSIIDQQQSAQYLTSLFKDPVLKEISDVPFASQHSISWYKQSGTENQKRKLGEQTTAMNNYVSAALKMFGSRATDLDVRFLKEDLKPSDKDTMAVRQGKVAGSEIYINSKLKRIQLAEQYMRQNNMSQTQAEFAASKQIDLDKIRKDVYDSVYEKKLNIKPSEITADDINHTAKQLKISPEEVIKRLNDKGIYLPNKVK